MKKRIIIVYGYNVELWSYRTASYLYPSFNGNAEFKATKDGFKELCRYLRNIRWMDNLITKSLK